MWRPVQSAARYCSPQVFEFIAHDKKCCKPDQIDRDVRHGQLLMTMMMMMYTARYCSPQVFEFIAHDDWLCSKPDEVDRDVRHGHVTQDHDDVCMCVLSPYACMHVCVYAIGSVCMYVCMRAKLPFKCETCGERFSRQQDIARHKCSSSSRTTSSAVSQTK